MATILTIIGVGVSLAALHDPSGAFLPVLRLLPDSYARSRVPRITPFADAPHRNRVAGSPGNAIPKPALCDNYDGRR